MYVSNTTPFPDCLQIMVLIIYVKSIASKKTKNFLQNENHIINKKVIMLWILEKGAVLGKNRWEFYTSNCTEITFTVEFGAWFLQNSLKLHETWPFCAFQGKDFKFT